MPHNASANMENVMMRTDPIDGIFDKEGMMAFMNTISNEGGELVKKKMKCWIAVPIRSGHCKSEEWSL